MQHCKPTGSRHEISADLVVFSSSTKASIMLYGVPLLSAFELILPSKFEGNISTVS